jgi:nucleoside-diphosphate-sugar epimerase
MRLARAGALADTSRVRVFVTGGTGFIGSHLCRRLAERGDEVVALVRSKKKAAQLPARTTLVEGDLSLFADSNAQLPPCDVVIHLAGVVAADRVADYEAINFDAVKNLIECIERQSWKPRRLLFASSLAAAGPSPKGAVLTEGDPPRPIDPYGDAKARAEPLVRAAPFPTTIFRPPMVLGPGDEASLTLFRAARARLGFRVAGAPQELSFVDVRDLVEAILLMADDRRTGHYCYYASHPAQTDTRALWRELAQAVGRRVLVLPVPKWVLYLAMLGATAGAALLRFRNQLDSKQYAQMIAPAFLCSGERLRRDLGWKPRHELADCLAFAAAGYRAAGQL